MENYLMLNSLKESGAELAITLNLRRDLRNETLYNLNPAEQTQRLQKNWAWI
jgi:hypothetical protein